MKQIVTIDFDIIMAPSIYLYNDDVPDIPWDYLLNNPYEPNLHLLRIDAEYYQRIFQYIIEVSNNIKAEQIHFVEDHGQVVSFVKERSDIYNIDFHHDIAYEDDGELLIDEIPTCANWVYYLNKKGLLNSYTWLKAKNRGDAPPDQVKVKYKIANFDDFDLTPLLNPDEVIIALSEPWVPPYLRALYFTIMDYCNNYYNTSFEYKEGTYLGA